MGDPDKQTSPAAICTCAHQSKSFENILMEALPSLKAFAISLVKDHTLADDLVQETALKAWDKQASFSVGTNIKAWLFTILRNTYLSWLRKSRREAEDPDNLHTNNLCVPAAQEFVVEMNQVSDAIQKLSSEQKQALLLVGERGYSYEEAAEIANCAVGTIKSRTSRARKNLSALDR